MGIFHVKWSGLPENDSIARGPKANSEAEWNFVTRYFEGRTARLPLISRGEWRYFGLMNHFRGAAIVHGGRRGHHPRAAAMRLEFSAPPSHACQYHSPSAQA